MRSSECTPLRRVAGQQRRRRKRALLGSVAGLGAPVARDRLELILLLLLLLLAPHDDDHHAQNGKNCASNLHCGFRCHLAISSKSPGEACPARLRRSSASERQSTPGPRRRSWPAPPPPAPGRRRRVARPQFSTRGWRPRSRRRQPLPRCQHSPTIGHGLGAGIRGLQLGQGA